MELPWPFGKKITEAEEVSQLGCMASGNKATEAKGRLLEAGLGG